MSGSWQRSYFWFPSPVHASWYTGRTVPRSKPALYTRTRRAAAFSTDVMSWATPGPSRVLQANDFSTEAGTCVFRRRAWHATAVPLLTRDVASAVAPPPRHPRA